MLDRRRAGAASGQLAITAWYSFMMEPRYVERLEALKHPWCTAQLVKDLLGVDLDAGADPKLAATLRSWAEKFRGDPLVTRPSPSGLQVHRHKLETFLLQNGARVMEVGGDLLRTGSAGAAGRRRPF